MINYKYVSDAALIIFIAYIVGSIPTSVIVGKLSKGIDIRKHGSGNAGGTNTFRVIGWKAGVIVALFDIFKGFASVVWISKINIFHKPMDHLVIIPILAGAAAIIGHCYTVFAGFKGGKGIATSAGILIGLYHPAAILICVPVFAIVLVSSGYVSLSSLAASAAFPLTVTIMYYIIPGSFEQAEVIFSFIMGLFMFYTHRSNIKRLLAGNENRFNKVRILKGN
ncbi:glycerol-3-phosphate acyltransferase [Oxobacter pfennigii]|uniref:Glycerol-3-phosphate acyltransferase n=1 Tax=Oxobacter pfennigii TaxID=36849 RepID=A0A0N8NTQ2_9CLOT|nr:glycerol-3-phosphate 1-O-acyltransferase PlsY [Oxobacter pfennigii]KPU45464.1 glycerol-3-phosphate acyltransferase [Oxobacter pfennigii]